jgi:drug/metabolite transporter (DMT)-like permease
MRLAIGLRYMIEGAFYFSLMSVFAKLAGATLPFQEVVLGRSIVALGLSLWMLRRARVSVWGVNKPLLALRGILGFGGLCCFFYSVVAMPLADATVIHYINPVLVALLAAIFLGERPRLAVAMGSVLALLGGVLIARPAFLFGADASLPTLAVFAALGGAAFSAAAYTVVRKLGQTDHAVVVVFWIPLMSLPFVLPWVALTGRWPTWIEILWMVGVGVSEQMGQIRLTQGLALERAGKAMSMTYLQVVFAFVFGLAFFDEVPTMLAILGAGIVFVSTLWISSLESRPAKLGGIVADIDAA